MAAPSCRSPPALSSRATTTHTRLQGHRRPSGRCGPNLSRFSPPPVPLWPYGSLAGTLQACLWLCEIFFSQLATLLFATL